MMKEEEKIKINLVNKFSFLQDAVLLKRPRRIWVSAPLDKFIEVFAYLFKDMKFSVLSAITGLQEADSVCVIYHLSRDSKIVLNLKVLLPLQNPVIKTVTGYFAEADAYERELNDLLGVNIEGLAQGRRYPLPDDWPQGNYPLRKDWQPV